MHYVADLLEAEFEPLLSRWIALVGAELAPGRRSVAELTDHVPLFLGGMITALRQPGSAPEHSPIDGESEAGQLHGAQRFRMGFELEAVVREYGLLTHLILDLIESADASVSSREVRRMIDLTTNAVAEATSEYARRQEIMAQAAKLADVSAEASLRREAERAAQAFGTLVEAIPQQVWTALPSGELDMVNQRAVDYFALPQAQIIAAGWQGLMHQEDLVHSLTVWTGCLQTGADYECEFRLRRHDGEYRWHLSRARAARDEAGQVLKWFGTATDIDETKKTHDELRRRTAFEQHLVGIVSHDLRNPLGTILTGAGLLLRMEEQGERATKIATRIHSAAERSARMITDLLDFTQARLGGGIRLVRAPCDVYQIASSALDEVEVAYSDRTIELTRAGDAQGVWDADRLSQVVTNLLTNALKYSPAGTPVAIHIAGETDEVELTFRNQGPPIAEVLLARIFEPLQRASDQIDRKTRSVGLGLYIVDAIVTAHQGIVSVSSTLESGTCFTVRLPREARGSEPRLEPVSSEDRSG